MDQKDSLHDYAQLSPDTVLDAVESLGLLTDARVLALNSYENRVYQVGIEGADPIIAKFYRPGRWNDDQIHEEHRFTQALEAAEIPVVPPAVIDSETLFTYQNFRFSLFPRRGGHAPELDDDEVLFRLGQAIGRAHAVGKSKPFTARLTIAVQTHGWESREFLINSAMLPGSLVEAYTTTSQHLLEAVEQRWQSVNFQPFRLHGDCHPGNILIRDERLTLVDLDDCLNGPAVQDLWMLVTGETDQRPYQWQTLLDGYEEFSEFDTRQLALVEPLRALRMVHYAAWLARRWDDPAFPQAFPWFNSERYWASHVLELREQLAELQEPVVELPRFNH